MKIGKWYETHDHRAEQLQYDSLMPEVQLNLSFMRPQILTEQWVEELKPGAGRLLILQETKKSGEKGSSHGDGRSALMKMHGYSTVLPG